VQGEEAHERRPEEERHEQIGGEEAEVLGVHARIVTDDARNARAGVGRAPVSL
jgi:hypothetical protein